MASILWAEWPMAARHGFPPAGNGRDFDEKSKVESVEISTTAGETMGQSDGEAPGGSSDDGLVTHKSDASRMSKSLVAAARSSGRKKSKRDLASYLGSSTKRCSANKCCI